MLTPGKQALLQGKRDDRPGSKYQVIYLVATGSIYFCQRGYGRGDSEVIPLVQRGILLLESFDETKTIHGVITEICGYMSGVEDDRDDHGYKIRDKGTYNHDTIKIQEMQRTFPV